MNLRPDRVPTFANTTLIEKQSSLLHGMLRQTLESAYVRALSD